MQLVSDSVVYPDYGIILIQHKVREMNAVVKTAAIKFLKKITPKTVTAEQGIDLMNMTRPVASQVLYDLFGYINGYKQKTNDLGMWTQFKGQFRAVAPTGEMWESGATHIPVLEDIILSSLQAAKEADPRSRVELALRVMIVPATPGKPSMTGFEYNVQRLLPQNEGAEDPILLLMQAAAKANPPAQAQLTSDKPATVDASATTGATAAEPEKPAAEHTKGHARK